MKVVDFELIDLRLGTNAGGVGLYEYVQHLSMIDYVASSGKKDDRRIEYIDHLHERFVNPCVIKNGTCQVPSTPGFSIEIKPQSLLDHTFSKKNTARKRVAAVPPRL